MNNPKIETLEKEKRDLHIVKAKLIDQLETEAPNKDLFSQLGETVFNIFKIEKQINRLTENVIG